MTEFELKHRVHALREEAFEMARELSRHAARPGMGDSQMMAAERMQSLANGLGDIERTVGAPPAHGTSGEQHSAYAS